MKLMKWGMAAAAALFGTAVVAFGVLTFGGVAGAQEPGGAGGPGGDRRMHHAEVLAGQLGISVDELLNAQQATRDQIIAEALAAGRITPQQAEMLRNRQPGQGRVGPGHRVINAVHHVFDAAAKAIGVSNDELRSGLQSGKSLAQVASDHGVSRDQLKTGIVRYVQEDLQTAVTNGRLTQVQAGKLLEGLKGRLDQMIDRTGPLGRPGQNSNRPAP